jgi:hypothetical protein
MIALTTEAHAKPADTHATVRELNSKAHTQNVPTISTHTRKEAVPHIG